ncbi:hypothetical protein N9Y89_02055 [bacterium]|nr:hypothetical protein [bacterium]
MASGGQPPRAMFGYSFTQLFFLLHHYGLINDSFQLEFEKGIALLDEHEEAIKTENISFDSTRFENHYWCTKV